MAFRVFQDDRYREIMREHLFNTLAFVLENNQEFAIGVEVSFLEMDPELPREIVKGFGEQALFVLAGYTFESAWLDEEYLYFEAGFGSENIGTRIAVPLLAIKQIFVGEYPIAINIVSPVPKQTRTDDATERSMSALLSNPENQKLLNAIKKY
jgi:hypothetical protein